MLVIAAGIAVIYAFNCYSNSRNKGTLTVSPNQSGVGVYDLGKKLGSTNFLNKEVETTLAPGIHDIIAEKDDHYPWTRKLQVEAGEKYVLEPFLLPTTPNLQGVPLFVKDGEEDIANPEYQEVLKLFMNIPPPTDELMSRIKESGLMAVKNATLFPERDDVAIFASGKGVYAMELGDVKPRNFQPLYEGTDPYFVAVFDSVLYIKDGDVIYIWSAPVE